MADVGFGFVAGLPLPLSGFTLRLWLSRGVSLAVIGLTANIGLAYSLKFLWAPLLDRRAAAAAAAPVRPAARLAAGDPAAAGAGRGAAGAVRPGRAAPLGTVAAAALVAFLSASQDIVVDAWRIETFPAAAAGRGDGGLCLGLSRGAADLRRRGDQVAGRLGWHGALLAVAALIALGPLVTLLAPEPAARAAPAARRRLRRAR